LRWSQPPPSSASDARLAGARLHRAWRNPTRGVRCTLPSLITNYLWAEQWAPLVIVGPLLEPSIIVRMRRLKRVGGLLRYPLTRLTPAIPGSYTARLPMPDGRPFPLALEVRWHIAGGVLFSYTASGISWLVVHTAARHLPLRGATEGNPPTDTKITGYLMWDVSAAEASAARLAGRPLKGSGSGGQGPARGARQSVSWHRGGPWDVQKRVGSPGAWWRGAGRCGELPPLAGRESGQGTQGRCGQEVGWREKPQRLVCPACDGQYVLRGRTSCMVVSLPRHPRRDYGSRRPLWGACWGNGTWCGRAAR